MISVLFTNWFMTISHLHLRWCQPVSSVSAMHSALPCWHALLVHSLPFSHFFLLPLHSNSLCHWNAQIHPFVLNLLTLCNLDVLRPSLINSMRSSRPSVPLCPLPVTGGMGGGALNNKCCFHTKARSQ